MNKINQLKTGVILSYTTMIIQNVIAIVYTPIMLRLLGQSEYGLYQLVASVVSYLGLLSFGFGSAYVRFYSRFRVTDDQKGIARLNGMFMTVFVVIGLISLIAGYFLIINIDTIFSGSLTDSELSTARVLMILMVINMAISFPSSVFDSYVTAHECYFFQRIIGLGVTILNPFLTLPLLLLGYKSISLVVVQTILTFSKLFINWWYSKEKIDMHFDFNKMDFSLLKEIAVFSSFIFINIVVDQINWSVDKFVLGVFGGTAAVAIYAIGGQINTMYMSLSTSVSSVFIPRVNRIVSENPDDNEELTRLFTNVGRIQFIILSLVVGGFIVLGKYFIDVWAGVEYKNAFYVALLLIIPVTIPLIQNLGIEIQRAKNMHKFRSILYFLIALGNIVISVPLAKYYGAVGAAFGTMISMVLGNIFIMNWYYHVHIKLDMLYFWKNIFSLMPPIIISVLVVFGCKYIVGLNSIFDFVVIGIVYVIVYGISMYFIGMNEYEKRLIIGPIKRILKRS